MGWVLREKVRHAKMKQTRYKILDEWATMIDERDNGSFFGETRWNF